VHSVLGISKSRDLWAPA